MGLRCRYASRICSGDQSKRSPARTSCSLLGSLAILRRTIGRILAVGLPRRAKDDLWVAALSLRPDGFQHAMAQNGFPETNKEPNGIGQPFLQERIAMKAAIHPVNRAVGDQRHVEHERRIAPLMPQARQVLYAGRLCHAYKTSYRLSQLPRSHPKRLPT